MYYTPPVRQDKKIITKAVKETISSISSVKHAFHQHPSCSHMGLQIADYISYAIHGKLHLGKLDEYQGESVEVAPMPSGVTSIIRVESGGWFGATDPRREGVALGG